MTLEPLGRILCVTSNFPRWEGDSTTPFVLHLAQDLSALGWEIDILAPHAPGAARAERMGGLGVVRFRYLWPESLQSVCYQGGALINLRKAPLNYLKLPALVAAEWVATGHRLLSGRYDLVHSHWILPQGFTTMLANVVTGVPHVVTVHGGDVFGLKGRMMARFKRAALRTADAVTVNSSATEGAVRSLVPEIQTLHRIPMGVSTVPPADSLGRLAGTIRQVHRPNNGPLLIFVGRLVEEKGVEDLLRAVALLRGHLPDMTVLIVGEGQDGPGLKQIAHRLGIQDCTRFVGWVDPGEVPAYLAAADIFVGPSRRTRNGWIEAQGLTFLEAMAARTPVIATRLGGVPDFVIHEHTGLLVDERAPDQIARAVHRLATDSRLAQAIAERARARVQADFSRQASAAAFSDLFRDLCQRTRPSKAC